MPLYSYHCSKCDLTNEQMRKIADRDRLTICERCKCPTERKMDAPAAVWSPTSTGGGLRV